MPILVFCLQKRKIKIRKIRREMADIQNNNSMRECQEKIRQLNDQISSMGREIRWKKIIFLKS